MPRDLEQELEDSDDKYEKYIILDNGEKLYYDILINADSADYDCLWIKKDLSEPVLEKYTSVLGKRVDVIQCNATIDKNSVIKNGAPSYQSIEMMIAVNAKPNSKVGKFLIEKARKEYPLEYMKEYYYYLSLASCLFALDKENYPFSMRAKMVSRMAREFYPKAEFLSKARDYKYIDNISSGIQSINFGNISIVNPGPKKNNKENILEEISQMFIERVKEKINSGFSSEFIRKLDKLGAGKYLNNNLKNKLLDISSQKNKNVKDNFISDTTDNAESLIQDIAEIVRKNVGADATILIESQKVYEMSDIEEIVSDR